MVVCEASIAHITQLNIKIIKLLFHLYFFFCFWFEFLYSLKIFLRGNSHMMFWLDLFHYFFTIFRKFYLLKIVLYIFFNILLVTFKGMRENKHSIINLLLIVKKLSFSESWAQDWGRFWSLFQLEHRFLSNFTFFFFDFLRHLFYYLLSFWFFYLSILNFVFILNFFNLFLLFFIFFFLIFCLLFRKYNWLCAFIQFN